MKISKRPAVLLVNLGTPDSPAPADVRRFLRSFLTDRRIIETHPIIWRPILEGIILRTRPKASGTLYAEIWGEKSGAGVVGSPLMYWSIKQTEALGKRLKHTADVFLAMRYSKPTVPEMLTKLQSQGFQRVLIVPMYAQYSATTAASIMDEVSHWLMRTRNQMEIRTLRSFPEDSLYIEAIAQAIEHTWGTKGRPDFSAGDKLMLSFHSIPQAMVDNGDPYIEECRATARALIERLDLSETNGVEITFQSVFGPAQWVGPATIDTVKELAASGTRRIDVVCPGFLADCLESVHEINILNREEFVKASGPDEGFTYIPWANTQPAFLDALEGQVRSRLAGWID